MELLSGNYAMNLDDSDSEANFPLRSGRVLTQYTNLRPDTLLFTDALFGEDWTALGFPTPDRSTAIMDVWMAFGIAETCQNKEAAWQYIRMEMDGEGMVSQSANRKYIEEELERAALPVEDPDALANHAGYSIDEQELEPKPITKGQAENYLQLLENAGTAMVDPEVTAIVQEETEAFFAGDKTAEDTAKIIQNRVSIYLGEQS